jgi:hypothetical protein
MYLEVGNSPGKITFLLDDKSQVIEPARIIRWVLGQAFDLLQALAVNCETDYGEVVVSLFLATHRRASALPRDDCC